MALKRKKLGLDNKWVWAGLVFAGFLVVFGSFVPDLPSGYDRSDEFLLSGFSGGLMRSPGYPLYTILLRLVVHFLFAGQSVAFAGNLLSALLGSLGLSVLFLALWDLYEFQIKEDKRNFFLWSKGVERIVLGLVSVGLLGFSGTYLINSLVAERYILSSLLSSVSVWCAVNLFYQKSLKTWRVWFWCLAGVVGIGISHQWLFVMYLGVLGWMYYQKMNSLKLNDLMVGLFLLGLGIFLPYLVLWQTVDKTVAFSWRLGEGLEDLVEFVRISYLGDGIARADSLSEIISAVNLSVVLRIALKVFENWASTIGYWIFLPLLMSLVNYYTEVKRGLINLFGVWLLVLVSGIVVVLKQPENPSDFSVFVQQFLPVLSLLIVFIWIGLWELTKRFGAAFSVLFEKKKVNTGLMIVMLMGVFLSGLKLNDLKNYSFDTVSTLKQKMIDEVEKDAIIGCFSDRSCAALAYQQQVLGKRTDVSIFPYYFIDENVNLTDNDLEGFDYNQFPYLMFDVITWNIKERPIYVVDLFGEYHDFLGFDFGFIFYVPRGNYGKLVQKMPESLDEIEYEVSNDLVSDKVPKWDLMAATIHSEVAAEHNYNAFIYRKIGDRELAVDEANLASNLSHDLSQYEADSALALREVLEYIRPSDYYELGSSVRSVDYILEQIPNLVEVGLPGRALTVAKGAVVIDARSVEARTVWADLLAEHNASESAKIEYENILKLDDENEHAVNQLRLLESQGY